MSNPKMTVGTLVEHLAKLPPETEVVSIASDSEDVVDAFGAFHVEGRTIRTLTIVIRRPEMQWVEDERGNIVRAHAL